ncbi:Unknown protein, partial [Striga hermonthica]
EIIGRGDVVMERVESAENIADPLTKPLPQKVFEGHLEKMDLRYMSDWNWGKWEIVGVVYPA